MAFAYVRVEDRHADEFRRCVDLLAAAMEAEGYSLAGVFADESAGIGLIGRAADVLEAPVEGLDAAVVVGGPAAVLVAADFAFKPVHKGSCQFSVYSP